MTTTPDDALIEQIARALHGQASGTDGSEFKPDWIWHAPYLNAARAVLPIVRAAQVDALREAARGLSWFGAQGNTLDHLRAWDVVQTCMRAIETDADEIEKEI